jgi:hypothetical protein
VLSCHVILDRILAHEFPAERIVFQIGSGLGCSHGKDLAIDRLSIRNHALEREALGHTPPGTL